MTIPFDSLALACVASELEAWRGAWVRKIVQPAPTRIVLTLHHPSHGETRWLWDCGARTARTHLARTRPLAPETAPAFCMALRKYLEGARLEETAQLGLDRVLDARFQTADGTVTLRAELMGKHSNIVLISADERILAVAKPVSHRINRIRTLLPGRSYAAPPRLAKPDPRYVEQAEFIARLEGDVPADFALWLRDTFEGIGPFLAGHLAAKAHTADIASRWAAFEGVFAPVRENRWQPNSLYSAENRVEGAYPLIVSSWAGPSQPRDIFSFALEEAWADIEAREALEAQRATLQGQLRRALKAREKAQSEVASGIAGGTRAAKWRHWGELLMAYGYDLSPGATEAQLPDWDADDQLVSIPLDPELSPQENAARLFKRATAAHTGRDRLAAQAERLQSESAELRAALAESQTAASEELAVLQHQAHERGWLQLQTGAGERADAPDFAGHRVRAFTSPDGYRVLLGENAEANDYLVRHASSPNDWWLHARAGTSSHAIIKTNNHPERVPPSTMRFAAENVARRSAGKHAGMVAVDYTLRKYVRRPRGAAPGTVLREREKTLDVSPHGAE